MSLKLKYFVLSPTKDDPYGEASRRALKEYRDKIWSHDPELAADIAAWLIEIRKSIADHGVCCYCGYDGEEETECKPSPDNIHWRLLPSIKIKRDILYDNRIPASAMIYLVKLKGIFLEGKGNTFVASHKEICQKLSLGKTTCLKYEEILIKYGYMRVFHREGVKVGSKKNKYEIYI